RLWPHRFRVTADVAGVGEASDRAQRGLLAPAWDHRRRSRLLDRFRLEDCVLDMKVPAVKGGSLLRPHRADKPDGLLHLADAHGRSRREVPTVLAVLGLEITGADTERQPPPADQIDTGGDFGDMCGIALADPRGVRGDSDGARLPRRRGYGARAVVAALLGG